MCHAMPLSMELLSRIRTFRSDRKGAADAGDMSQKFVAGVIGVLVIVLVGVSLLDPIQDTIDNSSATGSAATLLALIPLLVVVGIVLVVVAWAIATGRFDSN